jgi:Phage-related minor tail protein
MITSYEVGAVFKIINEASPALTRILKQVRELSAAIEKARESLALIAKPASMGTAIAETGDLAKAWGDVAKQAGAARLAIGQAATASARAALPPVGIGGGGGGGRARRGVLEGSGWGRGSSSAHVYTPGVPLVGGSHIHFGHRGGGAAMAAGAALLYGMYQQAEVEDIAAKAMITGQMPVGPGMRYTDTFKELRDIIQKNSISGGFMPKEVGEAVLGSERQFAGLPFKKRMEVLNTMLPFAMQEARLKEGTGLKESAESLVGLAHMTGTYDTAKLPDLYRKFAYASQLTPKPLPQYTTALSYAMPSLVGGMGMDPDAVMFLTAMNQAAGIGSSKAGTWIQAFFSKLMPSTGHDLSKSKKIHNAELKKLGLIGDDGKPTWMVAGTPHEVSYLDESGNVKTRMSSSTDWMASLQKLSPILNRKLAELPDTERMQVLDDVFGKQGGREAGLFNLPEFIGQFPQLAKQLKMASGGEDVLKMLGEGSPVQQARTAMSEFTALLMDLGQHVLPPVNSALKDMKGWLEAIRGVIPAGAGPNAGATIGARAIEGAGIGAAWGLAGGPLGVAGGAVVGGVGGVAMGYLEQQSRENKAKFEAEDRARARELDEAKKAHRPPFGATLGGTSPVHVPPIHLNLNIDGRALAAAVSEGQARLSTYTTNSPASNGASFEAF